MPYVPHARLTFGGILSNTGAAGDIWSCGLSIGGQSALLTLPSPATTTTIQQAVIDWLSTGGSAGAGISSAARLDYITLAFVKADGKVARAQNGAYLQTKRLLTNPVRGNGGANVHPFQVAQVISLVTPYPGAAGRGRFYSPCPVAAVDGTGLIDADTATKHLNAALTMVQAINAALVAEGPGPDTPRVCVASRGDMAAGTGPANRPVTALRVGRVLDTLRTRRNALLEQYVAAPV